MPMKKDNPSAGDILPSRLLTVKEAAERCRSSEKTIWRLIKRKDLRARRVGRSVRIAAEDLAEYLSRAA
jgi:excisionase family DNA binding protein